MKESEEKKSVYNRKGWSIFGFLISILLLIIAIVLSINEEMASKQAKIDERLINSPDMEKSIEQASSEMSKSVNEVQSSNNQVNALNEINSNTLNETETLDNKNAINTKSEQAEQNKINEQLDEKTETSENSDISKNEETNQNNEIQQQSQTNESTSNENFIMPVDGEIASSFSIDNLQYSNTLQEWIIHRGIDIKADKTTVVKASKSGTVKYIKEDPRYGLSITIEHSDGFQTVYSSLLSTEFVKEGDKVKQGQSIGTVGNSAVFESADGSHLHFEILKDGEYVNPDIYLK